MVQLPLCGTEEKIAIKPTKIIALGLNYRDHIAESQSVKAGFTSEIPPEPVLFAKTPNVLIGPGDAIVIPKFIDDYEFDDPRIDYEAELALIIGEKCKNVPVERAWDVVYGYTCLNDVSQRNMQRGDTSGWFRGKSLDTFGPVGPCVVPADSIGNAQELDIICRLNGRVVQSSNTKHMIFPIPEILAFVSKNFSLMEGDIITTGTPSGVGPITHGDVVEVEIQGIGILRNPVVKEK